MHTNVAVRTYFLQAKYNPFATLAHNDAPEIYVILVAILQNPMECGLVLNSFQESLIIPYQDCCIC